MSSNIRGDSFGNPAEVREDPLRDVYARYFPDIPGLREAAKSRNGSALFASLSEAHEAVRGGSFADLLQFER